GLVTWKSGLLSRKKPVAAVAPAAPAAPIVRYGTVEIGASSENAKVFLWGGRTPLDVPHIDTGVTQGVPGERETYWPQTPGVARAAWKDEKALASAKLVPAAAKRPETPKITGSEPASDKYGTLHVTSQPDGAEVWLLVGFTPTMHMEGVRADKDYRFEIVAEH